MTRPPDPVADKRRELALYVAMNVTDGGAQDFRVADRIMALAKDYALGVLDEATGLVAGQEEWHIGHKARTCPLVVRDALRARLEAPPVAQDEAEEGVNHES